MVAGKCLSASVPQWKLWAPPPDMQRRYQGKLAMVNLWFGGVAYDMGGKGEFGPTVIQVERMGSGAGKEMRVRSSLLAALLCCNLR